jgi:hypothetical protein
VIVSQSSSLRVVCVVSPVVFGVCIGLRDGDVAAVVRRVGAGNVDISLGDWTDAVFLVNRAAAGGHSDAMKS